MVHKTGTCGGCGANNRRLRRIYNGHAYWLCQTCAPPVKRERVDANLETNDVPRLFLPLPDRIACGGGYRVMRKRLL